MSIKCVWTHLNKKKILAGGASGRSEEIDGEAFVVGETEEDFSDDATTVGDHSSDVSISHRSLFICFLW